MTSEAQISEQQNLDEIALAYRSNHDVQWLLRQLAASRASEARLRAALENIHQNVKGLSEGMVPNIGADAVWYFKMIRGTAEAALAAAAAPTQEEGDE